MRRPPVVHHAPRALALAMAILLALVARPARAQDAGDASSGDASSGDASAGDASASPPVPGGVVPPAVIAPAHPTYPGDGDGRRVDVELVLTVDEQGRVANAEVLGHIPADVPESFDRAAREAADQVRFRPATIDGQPVAVRVRFHMAIAPPVVALDAGVADAAAACELPENEIGAGCEGLVHSHGVGDGGSDAGASAQDAGVSDNAGDAGASESAAGEANPNEQGVDVRARANRERTATEFRLPIGALANVPRTNGNDVMRLAPGVVLSNEGGTEGHAEHVYLRGFTGESGQDIAFSLDGVPLNEEGNTHAQGYADLYFVIPELVARLDVTEGVADPRQGNFAIAGSMNYHLGLTQRGATLRGSLGQYGYRRAVALFGPSSAGEGTFAGADFVHSDGFGPARAFDRASGMAQYEFSLGRGTTARLFGGAFTSRWDSPGLLREDDFDSGRVGFYGTYANSGPQGGASSRAILSAAVDFRGEGERASVLLYGGLRDLLLRENFTGYFERPDEGDLTQQTYGGGTVGASGFYQRDIQLGGRVHQAELGWFARYDRYAMTQQPLVAATGLPSAAHTEDDVDAQFSATNVGAYADAVIRPLPRTTLRGGIRLDGVGYQVDSNEMVAGAQGFARVHRSAFGLHVGPKATAEVRLAEGLTALASVGTGFRSPGPLEVQDGVPLEFSTVTAEEVGLRYAAPGGTLGNLTASLAGFHSYVSNDLLFDPYVGREIGVGPTRRIGGVFWVRTQPLPWIDVSASVSYTRATVESNEGGPTIPAGSLLPFTPGWVVRLDAAADREVKLPWSWAPATRAHGGLGITYTGPRPLQMGGFTEPVFLMEASAGLRFGPVDLSVSARNLLDARWRNYQSVFSSNWAPDGSGGATPVRHFNAGEPRTVFATLTLYY